MLSKEQLTLAGLVTNEFNKNVLDLSPPLLIGGTQFPGDAPPILNSVGQLTNDFLVNMLDIDNVWKQTASTSTAKTLIDAP